MVAPVVGSRGRRAEELGRREVLEAWYRQLPLAVISLARGSHADNREHALAVAASTTASEGSHEIAALATAYVGDIRRARELNDRGHAGATSPTLQAWPSAQPATTLCPPPAALAGGLR